MIETILSYVPLWLIIALAVVGVMQGGVAYLTLLERKVASWVQDRLGPNRVGPWGLLQPFADGLKFFTKEDYQARGIDTVLFTVAPAIMIIVVIVACATIPWGGVLERTVPATSAVPIGATVINTTATTLTYRLPFQIANLNLGVLYVLAALSLSVYGVVIGGWASNNKYSFLGGLRATANMISYEIPLGLAVLCIVMMFGTLDMSVIIEKQAHTWAGVVPAWNVFTQPLAFLMFLICIHAEANRLPFDLAECEQELVAGYHTEYSSMRFALFFMAEYIGMIVTSAVCVALFFGGWHLPYLTEGPLAANPSITGSWIMCLVRAGVFLGKTGAILFVFMWVRWSLPRFRFDQLMMLAWRALIPMSLALLMGTAVVIYFVGGQHAMARLGGKMALALLGMNIAILALTMLISRLLPPPPLTNRRVKVIGSRFITPPAPVGA